MVREVYVELTNLGLAKLRLEEIKEKLVKKGEIELAIEILGVLGLLENIGRISHSPRQTLAVIGHSI